MIFKQNCLFVQIFTRTGSKEAASTLRSLPSSVGTVAGFVSHPLRHARKRQVISMCVCELCKVRMGYINFVQIM